VLFHFAFSVLPEYNLGMKKTTFVWIIIILFFISILSELLSLVGLGLVGLSSYYGSYDVLNIIAVISLILDIVISSIFVYKLYCQKRDAILWTNITFGYAVLRLVFAMIADIVSNKGTIVGNGIEIIIIIILWLSFCKHLRKLIIVQPQIK